MSELVLEDGDSRVELFTDFSERRRALLESLTARKLVPLMQRDEWARSRPDIPSWLVATIRGDGECTDAIALSAHKSRALPGHWILHGEHVRTATKDDDARTLTLRGLTELASESSRILRVQLQCIGPPQESPRDEIDLAKHGFVEAEFPRSYEQTAVVDTSGTDDEIFAGLHKTARYNVRTATKRGAVLDPITDPAVADRLAELSDETIGRTGGSVEERDWKSVIRMSADHPDLSRLIGLYDPDIDGPDSILSFAWGCFHGDHGQYYFAASTRDTTRKISLGYAPVWDLIKWSRSLGAGWFDLGGITDGSASDPDPLGGISDFKRYFSSEVRTVGSEWQYEPNPARAKVAKFVGHTFRGAASAVSRVLGR